MKRVVEGFLLTRQWQDVAIAGQGKRLRLTFWLATAAGPLCLQVDGQTGVVFVEQAQMPQVHDILVALLGEPATSTTARGRWYQRPLALKSFTQAPVVGVYFLDQRALYLARDRLRQAGLPPLEADIQPTDRFLMERFITGAMRVQGLLHPCRRHGVMHNPDLKAATYIPRLTVMSLDIETSMSGDHLYSIGAVAGQLSEHAQPSQRVVFMVGPNTGAYRDSGHTKFDQTSEAESDYLMYCRDESHLLDQFLSWFEQVDPDVLMGWNVVNFDLRFLQRKADQLQRELNLGRDRGSLDWRQSRHRQQSEHYTLVVPGRVVLDGIDTLKSATYQFESFALQNVAYELLQRGKLIHDADDRGEEITRLFQQDKPALAAYNLEDCQLVWDIFRHTRLLDFALQRAQLTGLPMDRFGGSVAAFDFRYLPRLHRSGYVAPNLPDNPTDVGSPGGYVMDSQPGIYRNVLVLDFKSLYPSIIRTFKIDPLALIEGLLLEPHEPIKNRQETQTNNEQLLVPGFNGAVFSKQRNLLPELIGELWAARDQAKRDNRAAMSQAIKIIMNSFYGVLGTPGCRFFDFRLPSSITLRGHWIIQQTQQLIEQQGHQVIYGDTDSVFVWLKNIAEDSPQAQIRCLGEQLAKELNDWWQTYLRQQYDITSYLELEFESHFTRFIMPTIRGSDKGSKKRYAGLLAGAHDSSLESEQGVSEAMVFKGLEAVRSDWTPLARKFQKELYQRLFADLPVEEFIKKTVAEVRAGQRDQDLIYRKRIRRRLQDYQRNIPPHVQAAKLAEFTRQQQGLPEKYQRGGWIEYCLTHSGPEPLEFLHTGLDYDLYIERQIEPVVDGILHFYGQSFEQIMDQQMDLFS